MKVIRGTDLSAFATQVAPWLAQDAVRNNVITTVMASRLDGMVAPEDGLVLLRIVGDDGTLAGVAIRTPPHAMLLSELAPPAVAALADYLEEHAPETRGFNGPIHIVDALTAAVTARTGGTVKRLRGLGRYTLDQVNAPPPIPGIPRLATTADTPLVIQWVRSFHQDIGSEHEADSTNVEKRITAGLVWLWETDDGPAAMTAVSVPAHGVARVNLVFTPPHKRRHGYASALVAHLAQLIVDSGNVPMLFTDLENDTSNKIYQEIGFRKIDEAAHWEVAEHPVSRHSGERRSPYCQVEMVRLGEAQLAAPGAPQRSLRLSRRRFQRRARLPPAQ